MCACTRYITLAIVSNKNIVDIERRHGVYDRVESRLKDNYFESLRSDGETILMVWTCKGGSVYIILNDLK